MSINANASVNEPDNSTAADGPLARARADVSLKDLTTLRIGGPIAHFVESTTEDELIEAVRFADDHGLPLLVIGGGSNIVASDAPFDGVVVRDARSGVRIDQVDSCGGGSVTVPAGHNWDDFVVQAISEGWIGVESLIGIPGTVGAAPVQNIGAYGNEISSVISAVRVWDRGEQRKRTFALFELEFGYRDSKIKRTMTVGDESGKIWQGTPRYVVLDVSFQFRLGTRSAPVQYAELARLLNVEVGERAQTRDIAQAVLQLRAGKGMLVDAFDRPAVAHTAGANGTLPKSLLDADIEGLEDGAACGIDVRHGDSIVPISDDALPTSPVYNRWSAGSFFMNPVLAIEDAGQLPEGAPRFPVASAKPAFTTGPSVNAVDDSKVKTSAAWLIQNAGFDKGFGVHGPDSRATLSTVHTLALTNRGTASSQDLKELAVAVRDGVREKFGITLEPEPVTVGFSLNS